MIIFRNPKSARRIVRILRFTFLSAAVAAGFALYGACSTQTFDDFAAGAFANPMYRGIVQGTDLIADILPPPQYVLPYRVILQLAEGSEASDRMH